LKDFGCSAAELLQRYEAGELSDEKALTTARRIAAMIDQQEVAERVPALPSDAALRRGTWVRRALFVLVPVAVIVIVLLTHHHLHFNLPHLLP
jgi:hypothetical protein